MKTKMIAVLTAILALHISAAEKVWLPGGKNVNISDAGNWVGSVAPEEGDDLIITNNVSSNVTWDISFAVADVFLNNAKLTISKTLLANNLVASNGTMKLNAGVTAKNITFGGTGTVTMEKYPICADENCVIGGSVKITHSGPVQFPTAKVEIIVGGDLIVESTASINVDKIGQGSTDWQDKHFRGFVYDTSSGTGGGGWYGGVATGCTSIMQPYGNIYSPCDYGRRSVAMNGNISYGGGKVIIQAGGGVILDGKISSCGGGSASSSDNYATGSGGSIDITAASFSGAGSVNASGKDPAKNYGNSYPGSGGRIAIKLTGADSTFDGFTGKITAYGGARPKSDVIAGSGTIYLKTGSQSLQEGTLIIAGSSVKAGYTVLGGEVAGLEFGTIIVTNASLRIAENTRLKVSGDFLNYGRVDAESGSSVELVGNSPATFVGDTVFKEIVCKVPGKVLKVKDGAVLSVDELCYFAGGSLSRINFSSLEGGAWSLKLAECAISSMVNLNLSGCDASQGKTLTAANSTLTGCENITAKELSEGNLVGWTGAAGSDFENAANFSPMRVPLASDNVVVKADAANQPVMKYSCALSSLTVEKGATLSLEDGVELSVDGNISVAGSLHGASAKLSLGGKTSSVILGDALLGELDCSKVSGCGFSGKIVAQKFACENLSGAALDFSSGSELTVFDLKLKGDSDDSNITLGGSGWKLNAFRGELAGATVGEGCDVSGGTMFGLKGETDPRVLYVKGETELTEEIDLKVEGEKASFPTLAQSVGSLTVGAGAVVTVNGEFSVKRSVIIENGGELIWNKPGNIGGNLVVLDGGVLTHANVVGKGTTTLESNKINLNIGASVLVAEGGMIDAKGKGFTRSYYYTGGGIGWEHQVSSTHGGRVLGSKLPYGSIFFPTNFGSTATSDNNVFVNTAPSTADFGGGAIQLNVADLLVIDGKVDAGSSERHYKSVSSSGGSIFLKAGAILGKGKILSCGGNATSKICGAGGRISLVNEKARSNLFKGKVLAAGGKINTTSSYEYYRYGPPGTIYMQYGRTLGNGDLIIDADRWNRKDGYEYKTGSKHYLQTDLTPAIACDPGDKKALRNTKVIVRNGGRLMVTEDTVIKDLKLEKDHSYLMVPSGITLRILSFEHALGEKTTQVSGEISSAGVRGELGVIEWLQKGVKLFLR